MKSARSLDFLFSVFFVFAVFDSCVLAQYGDPLCGSIGSTYGNGVWVVNGVGVTGSEVPIWSSVDLVTWNQTAFFTLQEPLLNLEDFGIDRPYFANGLFIMAIQQSSSVCSIIYSTDGMNWNLTPAIIQGTRSSVDAFICPGTIHFQPSTNEFVSFGEAGQPAFSTDGIHWRTVPDFPSSQIHFPSSLPTPNPFSSSWFVPLNNGTILVYDSTLQNILGRAYSPYSSLIISGSAIAPVGYNSWLVVNAEDNRITIVTIVGNNFELSEVENGVITPGFNNYYFVSSPTQIALVQLLSSFINATVMFANLSDLNTWETVALPDLSYLGWDLVPSLTYAADHWYLMGSVYDHAFIFQSLDLKQWGIVYDGPCQDQKMI